MCYKNQGDSPNYHPNSFRGPADSTYAQKLTVPSALSGSAGYYNNQEEDNYSQPRQMVQSWTQDQQRRYAQNIASFLGSSNSVIQKRMIGELRKVDDEFGSLVETAIRNRTTAQVQV